MSVSSSRPGQPDASIGGRKPADPLNRDIFDDPRFQAMVRARTSFTWTLTIVMVIVYLAFILMVAFGHDVMATKVGGEMSLGIVIGFATIVFAFVLTGVYVAWANGHDELTKDLMRGRRS